MLASLRKSSAGTRFLFLKLSIDLRTPRHSGLVAHPATMGCWGGDEEFDRTTVDPAQMGGVPCVRHLRIPVAAVLRLLASAFPSPRLSLNILIFKRKICVTA